MSRPCTFTPEDNKLIIRLKANGSSWSHIAATMHRNRDRVREYALKQGLVKRSTLMPDETPKAHYDYSRQPMPAFHPTSWSAIWDGLITRP